MNIFKKRLSRIDAREILKNEKKIQINKKIERDI